MRGDVNNCDNYKTSQIVQIHTMLYNIMQCKIQRIQCWGYAISCNIMQCKAIPEHGDSMDTTVYESQGPLSQSCSLSGTLDGHNDADTRAPINNAMHTTHNNTVFYSKTQAQQYHE